MKSFFLSWKFLLRDYRSGELNLLILSLLIAVSVSTAIAIFSDRLQIIMEQQVSEIMGGDLIITGNQPLSKNIQALLNSTSLKQAHIVEFPTVVLFNDEMQMVSAKAVSANYPLRGILKISDEPFSKSYKTSNIPKKGEIWLEPRLFSLLNVSIGDQLQIGNTHLKVTQSIALESDRGTGFSSFSPRVMFNILDLPATQLIQIGSRILYKTLLAGDPKQINQFKNKVQPLLTNNEKLQSLENSNRGVNSSVIRLKQFLALGSLTAVLLSGIAIAMTTRRFAERRVDQVAIMRCLGASQRLSVQSLFNELLLIAVLISLPSIFIGWLLQQGLFFILKDALPLWLPQANIAPFITGGFTGIIIVIGFGLAPMLQLQQVTPLRILHKNSIPFSTKSWLIYGLAICAIIILLWNHTHDFMMTMSITFSGMILLGCIMLIMKFFFQAIGKKLQKASISLLYKLSIKRLITNKEKTIAQLLAFSLTFMAMAIVIVLRVNLLDQWQQKLPNDLPNYFALGIQPNELENFHNFLKENTIKSSDVFPIVRGRIVQINGKEAKKAVSESQSNHNALNRELSLTWTDKIPESNQLIEGKWRSSSDKAEVSIAKTLADQLNLTLNDQLTLSISGQTITTIITSIRKVNWENFRPNFYLIFPRTVLEKMPTSWLNSIFIPKEQKLLLNKFIRTFPTVTLIDIDNILHQVKRIIHQSSLAVEAMLATLLICGLLILVASLEATMGERLHESAVMRSFGATQNQLTTLQISEFILIGFLSGLIALIGMEICSFWLHSYVFKMPWQPTWFLWVGLPIFSTLLISSIGYMSMRKITKTPPNILINIR